jgi:hypothetical protein
MGNTFHFQISLSFCNANYKHESVISCGDSTIERSTMAAQDTQQRILIMTKNTTLTLIAIIALCALSACSIQTTATPAHEAALAEALPNLAYPIEAASAGTAQLTDGLFEEPAAPGSASMTRIQLGAIQAFGDINSDGLKDAAVTLTVDPDGSGTFSYLAVVLDQNGTLQALPAVFLGDRIAVQSLSIQPGQVVVELLTRAEGEPMSAEPTVAGTLTFKLSDDQLVAAD